MKADVIEEISVDSSGPKFNVTPNSQLDDYIPPCGDDFGPSRSIVAGYNWIFSHGQQLSEFHWSEFKHVLDSKTDPVASYDMCFRKGYDFYFRHLKAFDAVAVTAHDDLEVGNGCSMYVSGSDVMRAYYCKGPGAAHGFAYGIQNTRPQYTKAIFRSNKYGQFRDMLEQRRYGKFFVDVGKKISFNSPSGFGSSIFGFGEEEGVVACYFVNGNNGVEFVNPYSTDSCNMDFEASSSCPFVDGKSLNREPTEGIEFLVLAASEEFSTSPLELSDVSSVLDLLL
jgi:hypothetical protein